MVDVLEINGYRMLSWLIIVDIAYPVRGEICVSILVTIDLVLVTVQTNRVLDE